VRGTDATHDDGDNVYQCTWPVASTGVGKGCVFISDKFRGLNEMIRFLSVHKSHSRI
jgi:hypothetical protein